ncbi:MAG: hypothetical protein H6568_13890 [Lewinellaceae bacterium]|nr:hypothetical protein [Lewinellaceae bacterium]HRW76287.1 hypothetical protein [Saprospiraceae bacterium]
MRMMRTPLIVSSLALGLFALVTGCSSSGEELPWKAYPRLIEGRWDLMTAYRNDRETQTLNGTFFSFSAGQSMATNLPLPANSPSEGPFLVSKYALRQDTIDVTGLFPFQMVIQQLDSSVMVLTTTINQQTFRFDLSRS